ncbi:MAG: hypothetical protein FWC16_09670 [Defluviitaleaceae bacterium]|nr:hypothetical protein [Defluviitaleaceae bacterium]MCL2275181.1 hypothetical protein [Defluviitaleaceae bacterium]
MSINPIEIHGNWNHGFVLDKHVVSSTPIGENVYGRMQYETVRTELGELVYQLKYRGRYECINSILALISPFLDSIKEQWAVDVIIPIPASKQRDIQPVHELAHAIAQYLRVDYFDEVLEKTSSTASKDMDKSSKTLKGNIVAKIKAQREHNILLIDDLFQSGETLKECVSVLREDEMLKQIYVLVMTKTR